LHERAQNAAVIDAGVHEEALVLGGDESVDDMGRQVFISDENATSLANLGNQVAVAAEDPQGNLQRDIANRLGSRQAGLHIVVSADHSSRRANTATDPEPEQQNRRSQ